MKNAFAHPLVRLAAFIAIWELAARTGALNPMIIASPGDILAAARADGLVFLKAFRVTLIEIVVSVVLAWCAGIAFGLLAGTIPVLGTASMPLLTASMAVPLVIIYPLLMAWIGIGPESKIAVATVAGVLPVAINTTVGIRSVDRRYLSMALAMGAGPWQARFQVLLPLALPAIVVGLRVGTSLAIIHVLVCEMLASTDGIGFWISYHRALLNPGHVYLGIALALMVGWGANASLTLAQQRLGRWRSMEAGKES